MAKFFENDKKFVIIEAPASEFVKIGLGANGVIYCDNIGFPLFSIVIFSFGKTFSITSFLKVLVLFISSNKLFITTLFSILETKTIEDSR